MIASAPPTSPAEAPRPLSSQAVSGENSFQAGFKYIGRRKGNIFGQNWIDKFFLITNYWLVITLYRCEYNIQASNNPSTTYLSEGNMASIGGHFRPPQNEFAWNILGLEPLWWQTELTLNQGGQAGEGRNYARIRGDIPSTHCIPSMAST